jgi:hypothetical protein
MSEANPKEAIQAMLPTPINVGGYVVKPLRLGVYAMLERIESPVCTGAPMDMLGMIPTMYVMTHDTRTVLMSIDDNTFPEKAVDWADSLDPETAIKLQEACLEQLRLSLSTAPEVQDVDPLRAGEATTGG